MKESILRNKVIRSYQAGIYGSAIGDSQHRVDLSVRYQELVLEAWFALGGPKEPDAVLSYFLKKIPSSDISCNYYVDLIHTLTRGTIFPINEPWDAPYGWAFFSWKDEVKGEGGFASIVVSEALQSGATIKQVIEAGLDACQNLGIEGSILRERLDAVVKLTASSDSIQNFKSNFVERFCIPIENSYLETIPLALACVIYSQGNPYQAIKIALEFGRNVSATACLAGQISGALTAKDDLPPEILDQIIHENPEINIRNTSTLLGDFAIDQYRKSIRAKESVIKLSTTCLQYTEQNKAEENLLYDKIMGTLLGGSCGDAMGCPMEWMHYKDIRNQWGWVDRFIDYTHQEQKSHPFYEGLTLFSPYDYIDPTPDNPLGAWNLTKGTYSDDMRYRLLLCYALLEKGNGITGAEFADLLLRCRFQAATGVSSGLPSWKGPEGIWLEQLTSSNMLEGMFGHKQPVGYCYTWDGPVGLIYPANEEMASRHGYIMATCISHAFHPGATFDSLVECACKYSYLYGELELKMQNRIQAAVKLAQKCKSFYHFCEKFYEQFLIPQPSWGIYFLEQIPAALALLSFGINDPKQAILSAINFGRDTDTIACMVGELAGALFGASALPSDWTTLILTTNPQPDLSEIALRFKDLALIRSGKIMGPL